MTEVEVVGEISKVGDSTLGRHTPYSAVPASESALEFTYPWSILDSRHLPCSWSCPMCMCWDLVRSESLGNTPDLLNQIHIKGAETST